MAALSFGIGTDTVRLTCSFGVSEWETGDTIDRLLKRADAALYIAKTSGRNRVAAADAALMAMDVNRAGGVVRAVPRRGA